MDSQDNKHPMDKDLMQHNTLPTKSKKRQWQEVNLLSCVKFIQSIFTFTHPRSSKTLPLRSQDVLRGLLFFGMLWGFWCALPNTTFAGLLPKQKEHAQKLTENLLHLLEQQHYDQVIQQLHPSLRRTLTVEQLGEYIERIFRITGPYQKRSLQLHAQLLEGARLRLVWSARFLKDHATVMVLFDQKTWQIGGFVIQSPRIQGQLRKETPQPLPTGQHRKHLEQAIDLLMQGYNQGDWAKFSRPCGEVMRLAMRPPRFAFIRKGLLQRFGRYKSRSLVSAHKLSPENHLILRYHGRFEKQSALQLQVIFARQHGGYVILWWQLRPLAPKVRIRSPKTQVHQQKD